MYPKFFMTALAVILAFAGKATTNNYEARQIYIENYKEIAIREMHSSGIPASIILAQAILESGNGNSQLARESNNHFGIKCKSDWQGMTYHHKDDDRDENDILIESCFRAYTTVEESFVNHSDFLKNSKRYEVLFTYGEDYKKWAKGLQDLGYASSNTYAERLIEIIETNDLYAFDLEPYKPIVKDDNNELAKVSLHEPVNREALLEYLITIEVSENKISNRNKVQSNALLLSTPANRDEIVYESTRNGFDSSKYIIPFNSQPPMRRTLTMR